MMLDIYTFIDIELQKFSDKGIYDSKLKPYCIDLNNLLNNVTNADYRKHLGSNSENIDEAIRHISVILHKELYIDFSEIFYKLLNFQQVGYIEARDHYYHSIQCFLLSLALFRIFNTMGSIPSNITAILFSLTIYHDIGYLYHSIKSLEINFDEKFADIILCKNILETENVVRILCLENEFTNVRAMEGSEDEKRIRSAIITMIQDDNDIKAIWAGNNLINEEYLRLISEVDQYPSAFESHHSTQSALLLSKVLLTKNIIRKYFCSEFHLNDADIIKTSAGKTTDEKLFRKIIQAIFFHDFKHFDVPMSLGRDFFSVYLMIIDELQTYGRTLAKDTYHKLINPKDIGFHWDSSKNKLRLDKLVSSVALRRKCGAHSNRRIKKILSSKIDATSLQYL
jgi:hypothetical protein